MFDMTNKQNELYRRFLYMMGGHDAVLHGETHTMAL